MEETPMEKRAKNYSIKCMLTDRRSGEVLNWIEDFDHDKDYAEREFEHLSNAHQTCYY